VKTDIYHSEKTDNKSFENVSLGTPVKNQNYIQEEYMSRSTSVDPSAIQYKMFLVYLLVSKNVRHGSVAGSADHDNQPSIYIKGVKFHDQLSDLASLERLCSVEFSYNVQNYYFICCFVWV
jgi:hypothetical protein